MRNKEKLSNLDKLGLTLDRFNKEPQSARLISETWEAVFDYWSDSAKNAGLVVPNIKVEPLNVPLSSLNETIFDSEGLLIPTMMIFYPPVLRGKDGLILMGKMFPQLGTRTVKDNTSLQSENDFTGWLNVEAVFEAPNVNTTEHQLREHFNSTGRIGMSENQYIIFSLFTKLAFGRYVDYSVLCRLLDSRLENYVINARFGASGDLHVNSHLRPSLQGEELGGRSIKVIQ
ncbi:hypothetical protein M1349_01630 [Patescibacteria group bacterium]|nr:hypothetical protein [Patescibacteria group bacterium]